jgi:hypothetical protein
VAAVRIPVTARSAPEFDVAIIGAGAAGMRAAAAFRRERVVGVIVLEKGTYLETARHLRAVRKFADVLRHIRFRAEVVSEEFDDAADSWAITTRDGVTLTARIVVDATGDEHLESRFERSEGQHAPRRPQDGPAPYLGVATHGVPNHFVVAGPDTGVDDRPAPVTIDKQIREVVALARAMRRGEATRVEVKRHVQQQADRTRHRPWSTAVRAGRARPGRGLWCRTTATRALNLGDFEFTRPEDREEDDGYRGPATLLDNDGTEHPVQVHVLAQYEPVDNTVHWSGRIDPAPALTRLHRTRNQRVALRLPGYDAVPAQLTDADPWGGSHILGEGASPYPLGYGTPPLDGSAD